MNDDVRTYQMTEFRDNLNSKKQRKDAYQNPILKGLNQHKIAFRDLTNKGPLSEIYIVENYKTYNFQEYQVNKKTQVCDCIIN